MATISPLRPGRLRRPGARSVLGGTVAALALLGACTSAESGSSAATTTSASTTTTTTAPDPGPGPTSLAGVSVGLETVVGSGLDAPTAMAPRPGRDQIWIAERGGRVRILSVDTEWDRTTGKSKQTGYTLLPGNALDLSSLTTDDGERGLLGLAFSTDGRTLYVDHTAANGDVVVAAYDVVDRSTFSGGTGGPAPRADQVAVADPATRLELLTVPHREQSNHNGGQLVLGPDGYLYVGVGDGGGSGDPSGNAQDPESLLGKILRIDPATIVPLQTQYSIPPDNPFAQGGGRPEIWVSGVRNPWRFSFDRETGDLWVADVGQDQIEEIDRLAATDGAGRGADLGWNWFEGDQRFRVDGTPPEGLVEPIHTYDHTDGRCSITGGYVYRGSAVKELVAASAEGGALYVYGDYCSGEVRGLLTRKGIVLDDAPLGASTPANSLVSFGQDEAGELYVLSARGTLSKVVAG